MSMMQNDSAFVAEQMVRLAIEENAQRTAPSVLRGLIPFKDGNQWCVLLGPNIQEGICGFGDSPREACAQFDALWNTGVQPTPPKPTEKE